MPRNEIVRRLELRAFGGILGRVAVDVQKGLMEQGLPKAAVDFNTNLDRLVDQSHNNLNETLKIASYLSSSPYFQTNLETQLKIAERLALRGAPKLQEVLERLYRKFLNSDTEWKDTRKAKSAESWRKFSLAFRVLGAQVVQDHDGTYSFTVPNPPYKHFSGLNIPWGEVAEITGRSLGALNGRRSIDILRDAKALPVGSEGLRMPTRHEGVNLLIAKEKGVSQQPKLLLVIPTRTLITTKRRGNEMFGIYTS